MSTYAAYFNLTQADKAEKVRRASEQSTSSKNSSAQPSRRSSIQKVLDQLRPTEEVITPAGIYTPIIKNGPLFSRKSSSEKKAKAERKASKDIKMSPQLRDMMHAAA